jgi:murein DD-endopeptidase MepM/ murein hydrolase activator NlpD
MQQPYFIVVLAHSLHGKLRRINIPYAVLYSVLALAVVGAITVAGFVASYARMAVKVSRYNALRDEVSTLRSRYDNLRKEAEEKAHQLATFQLYASEVSSMFGLRSRIEGPASIAAEGKLVPSLRDSIAEYDFLRYANFSQLQRRGRAIQTANMPSLWPVNGNLTSYFGKRADPFSGEGAMHPGIDISVPSGTQVRAAADGVVGQASFFGGYGRIVVIDHGGGCSTYYAHLSRFDVLPGQSVRRGDIIGYSGSTGRSTSPHLHYEVRMHGVPVNPYPYLMRSATQLLSKRDLPF